jgi:DNA helicase-2/ATP-dependent DNA helicase PcrA
MVDEVFDANQLDLDLVHLACDAGAAITLIGDPWQALYRFRGAAPELVPDFMRELGFAHYRLDRSFRFQTELMKETARGLRAGEATSLASGTEYDVLLASKWESLWRSSNNILPLSFGQSSTKTDAAIVVLLDHVVRRAFGERAMQLNESLTILGLDEGTYLNEGPSRLAEIVELLLSGDEDAGPRALARLREVVVELGATGRLRRSPDGDAKHVAQLTKLMTRITAEIPLVCGMTVHQSKGREWERVGLALTRDELGRLNRGLSQSDDDDRRLYVAITRARSQICIAR